MYDPERSDDIADVVRTQMTHVDPHYLLGYLASALRLGQTAEKTVRCLRSSCPVEVDDREWQGWRVQPPHRLDETVRDPADPPQSAMSLLFQLPAPFDQTVESQVEYGKRNADHEENPDV